MVSQQKQEIPKVIQDVGFDFSWSEEKVWKLNVPVEEMDISELEWHFTLPFWNTAGGYYDLKPTDVIEHKDQYQGRFERIMKSDLSYPLDIMFWKNRWLLLDGLHRLVKAKILGMKTVMVRKIPQASIPEILKD